MTKNGDASFYVLSDYIFNQIQEHPNNFTNLKFTHKISRDVINNYVIMKNSLTLAELFSFPTSLFIINLICTTINLRARWLNVSNSVFHDELDHKFLCMFMKNRHPRAFINRIGKPRRILKTIFVSLPYVGRSSMIIGTFLKKLNPEIFVAFENHR